MITIDNMMDITKAMDAAQEDDTPFLSVSGENVSVIGDPTKSEPRNRDYTVTFGIPKEWKDRLGKNTKIVAETDYEYAVEATFKNVFVPARNRTKVTTAVAGLMPFLRKSTPAGDVESLSADEYVAIARSLNDEVVDAVYDVLRVVFRLDEEIAECILLSSAMLNVTKLFYDLPGVVNESDLFTESSAENK